MIFYSIYDIFITGRETMRKDRQEKKVFSFRDVSLIVVACSLVMCFLGATLVYKHLGGVNFALIGSDSNLKEFISAYNSLVDKYYDSLDTKSLIEGAIKGMYATVGDPYTTYLDENSSSSLDDSLRGSYNGIGISVDSEKTDEGLKIVEVYEDSPAAEKGLQSGDIILKINDVDTIGKDTAYLTDLIKSGKEINLTVSRNGSLIYAGLKATSVMVPVVESQILEQNGKKVGYLRLSIFNDTADIQVSNHLAKLEKNGLDGLILDLRDNGGGYLNIAENIAEIFLEKGKTIYSLESKNSTDVTLDDTSERRSYPISVVVNKNSASASEILAAALKYSYGASLVGNKTYGKGKVQEREKREDGTTVKYTTAKWLTPAGTCIDGIGLVPNVEVELNYDVLNQDDVYTDNQVMTALNNLVG